MHKLKINLISILLLICKVSITFAQESVNKYEPKTLIELQESIQEVLKVTNTAGAGIVMMNGDSVVWMGGLGKADIEKNIDADENTLFRLGSVSKLFVGLAILKLQEEGRLNLKDKLKDVIPDLKIINPWEDQYPIRIENLLEHTAGFNDWSLAELACNNPNIKTLKESLEYYPKGRTAHYVPGTRTQYSNLGVSIAAYIVERVSGMPYDEYIDKYFFKAMGITDMSYSNSEKYKKIGAKGYDNGKLLDFLYPLYRPSAGLIGSPNDLSKLLKFFINRGEINNTRILSDSSLQRMERGESFNISKSAIFSDGIGLTNYISSYKGFAYHGHGGHVPGSHSDFKYLPKYNLGFAVIINNDDDSVLDRISSLIMAYQTKDLAQEPVKLKEAIHNSTIDLSGYYINVNSKFKLFQFFDKMKFIQKIWSENDTLHKKYVLNGNSTTKYIQIENKELRSEYSNKTGFIQLNDPVEGQVIYGNMGMFKKIPSIYAYTLLTLFWAFFIVPFLITVFAVLRLLIYLFGKKKNKIALWISLWPFISISFILVIVLALFMSLQTTLDTFLLLGNSSPLSLLIFMGTIGFALASLWSIYYLIKNRRVKMSRVFYYHSALAAIFNIIFTIYFLANGLIGIMTWM